MKGQEVARWVQGQVSALGLWLSKTVGELTAAALTTRRLGVVTLAMGLTSQTTLKHRAKRVDRYLGNERGDLPRMFEGLGRLFWRGRQRVLLTLDWTELPGRYQALVLSVIVGRRAVPIAWQVVAQWRFHKSRNAVEQGLLLLAESFWPATVERIVIADRGFGYAEMARFLQEHGWSYILRVPRRVWVQERRGGAGLLGWYPVSGRVRGLKGVRYRSTTDPVEVDVVWTHQKGQREPWYLITNRLGRETARQVVTWYGWRMRGEESRRDGKSERWGFGLNETRRRRPERWSRLLLIWAWTLVVLHLLGAWARDQQLDRGLTTTSRRLTGA